MVLPAPFGPDSTTSGFALLVRMGWGGYALPVRHMVICLGAKQYG